MLIISHRDHHHMSSFGRVNPLYICRAISNLGWDGHLALSTTVGRWVRE
jgi:hypothetical protein